MTYTPCWPNFDPGRGQGGDRAGQGRAGLSCLPVPDYSWHKSPAMVFNYSTISASPSPLAPLPATDADSERKRKKRKQTNKQTNTQREAMAKAKQQQRQWQTTAAKLQQRRPNDAVPSPPNLPTPLPYSHYLCVSSTSTP